MALALWSTFADGKVQVSVDVISGSFAGVSVLNTSGKAAVVNVWSGATLKAGPLNCPSQAAPTASATLISGQRFAWTAGTDWRVFVAMAA